MIDLFMLVTEGARKHGLSTADKNRCFGANGVELLTVIDTMS